MVDLIQREGGYKERDEFRLSKATAEGALKSLTGDYFTVVGNGKSNRYVPAKSPSVVGFEPAEPTETPPN